MKAMLLIIIAAILVGCRTADSPGHNWRPPGMLMQAPSEKGEV